MNRASREQQTITPMFFLSRLVSETTVQLSPSVEWHGMPLPVFVESELERLYGNLYASLPQLRVAGVLGPDCQAYIVRDEAGVIITLLLLASVGRMVRVLLEGMRLEAADLERFATHAFQHWQQADVIALHAVPANPGRLSYPCQHSNFSEDYVLALPDGAEEYRASLGKSTRAYLSRYLNRVRREYPSFQLRALEGNAIGDADLQDLLDMNRARMREKGRAYGLGSAEAEQMRVLARGGGLLFAASIDGRMRAGMLCYRTGNNYFMSVLAHDPAYNDYRLGTLCCYLGICECIARGGANFHFLWGQYDYKSRLGGIRLDLDDMLIYRSRTAMARQAPLLLRTEMARLRRHGKLWLETHEKLGNPLARCALACIRGLRQWKERLAMRLTGVPPT